MHRKLIDIAGDPLIQNLKDVICVLLLTQMARTTPPHGDNEKGRRMYTVNVKPVREHDPDAAAHAMEEHMQAALDRLEMEPS